MPTVVDDTSAETAASAKARFKCCDDCEFDDFELSCLTVQSLLRKQGLRDKIETRFNNDPDCEIVQVELCLQ